MATTLRIETGSDYEAIDEVIRQAFEPVFGSSDGEVKVVRLLRESDEVEVFISLVAEDGGKVVGQALFSSVAIDTRPGVKAATLGPIGVLPRLQKQGVGSALIGRGLAMCKERGVQVVTVTGGVDYYKRFGFGLITETGLKTVFDCPVDMIMELEQGILDGVEGVVAYPGPWGMFLEG